MQRNVTWNKAEQQNSQNNYALWKNRYQPPQTNWTSAARQQRGTVPGAQFIFWVALRRPVWLVTRFHFKIKSIFWTIVHCLFWLGTYWQTWFELSRVKLYRKWPEGKRKLVRVSGRFELPRVKLQKMYDGNPGEIDFGSIKLARGSSYRKSTVT